MTKSYLKIKTIKDNRNKPLDDTDEFTPSMILRQSMDLCCQAFVNSVTLALWARSLRDTEAAAGIPVAAVEQRAVPATASPVTSHRRRQAAPGSLPWWNPLASNTQQGAPLPAGISSPASSTSLFKNRPRGFSSNNWGEPVPHGSMMNRTKSRHWSPWHQSHPLSRQ